MEFAHVFEGCNMGKEDLSVLGAVCGSIDEHVAPHTDREILASTPSVKYWFDDLDKLTEPAGPRLVTADDIDLHVSTFVSVVSVPTYTLQSS